jgi:serralysin
MAERLEDETAKSTPLIEVRQRHSSSRAGMSDKACCREAIQAIACVVAIRTWLLRAMIRLLAVTVVALSATVALAQKIGPGDRVYDLHSEGQGSCQAMKWHIATTAANSMAAQTAIRAYTFIDTIGVNTHIDFAKYGYQNLAVVEAAINYLGLKNLRDSAQTATDAQTWLRVAQATGAKFDDYIAEASPPGMAYDSSLVQQLASEGILNYLEGGNEEDDAYPASLGNTLAITAQFQRQVYATGHALGLPVINMSFGAGWTAANNWQGHYGDVGDLYAYADYANAHTYPLLEQGTDWTTRRLNGLALLAAASRPVITTEIGWNESQGFGQDNIAKRAIQAVLDGMKNGNVKTYFYALYDDESGLFGLMIQDGTAKPAGTAIHNLTTLLADGGTNAATFAPGSLAYTLGGATANDNALLMQKSDGSYWLSLWNENDAAHNVTLILPAAAQMKVFDPLKGTGAIQNLASATSATLKLSDHPMLVEVIGGASNAKDHRRDRLGGAGIVPPPTPTPTPAPSQRPRSGDHGCAEQISRCGLLSGTH